MLVNDRPQGSVATRVRNGGFFLLKLCYKFTAESTLKEFIKLVDIWLSYQ